MKTYANLGSSYTKSFKGFPEGKTVNIEAKLNPDVSGKFSAKIQQKADGSISAEQSVYETRSVAGQKVKMQVAIAPKKNTFTAEMKDFAKISGLNVKAQVVKNIGAEGYDITVSDEYVKDNFALTSKTEFAGKNFKSTELTGSYSGLIDSFTVGAKTKFSKFSLSEINNGLQLKVTQDLGAAGEVYVEKLDGVFGEKSVIGFFKKVDDNLSIAAGYETCEKGNKVNIAFKKQLDNKQELKVKVDSKAKVSTALKLNPFDNTSFTLGASIEGEKASFGFDVKVADTL